MFEEPVSSPGKGMPRSTMMVMALGSVALLLCTASALVGGVFLGAVVFQTGGFSNNGPVIEYPAGAPMAPTMVRPESSERMPTVPAPDFMQATATPVPFAGENAPTATPLPFSEIPTVIP